MTKLIASLDASWLGMPIWVWIGFIAIVLAMLTLDLCVFHRDVHVIETRESLLLAGFFLSMGLAFSVAVWFLYFNHPPETLIDPQLKNGLTATERAWTAWQLYLTAVIIEQSLSLDNIFVISLVFSYFAVPRQYQHRVLFWGILGVIVMRGGMIAAGAKLIEEMHWVLYVFGLFLVATGVKMLIVADSDPDIGNNVLLKFMRRHLRVTNELHGQQFFVRQPHPKTGRNVLWVTPLLLCLAVIEFIDVVFAVDSVPAVFAITTEPFIVYTSNIFAILGLRSLYFALAAMVHRFEYLKYALALVLVFIGGKIFASAFIGKIPTEISLGVTVGLLVSGVVYSWWRTRRQDLHGQLDGNAESGSGEARSAGQ